jgi:protease-4
MRFLTNALSGREALLIDPAKATDHKKAAEAAGFTDMVAALFGSAPKPYKAGSVGIIPLQGVIGKSLSPLDKMTGAVDLNDFANALHDYEEDEEVKTILIDISSPGGTVTGVEEVGMMLAQSKKATVAFTETEMASAAYWIGSQADRVVATPSATVGSIGVYMAFADVSKAYESMGVKMEVIKSGTLKGAGIEGTSLSEAQRADLQEQVNAIHADFRSAVKAKRSNVSDSDMEGQIFSGKVAASKGLVTGLTTSFNQLLGELNGKAVARAFKPKTK